MKRLLFVRHGATVGNQEHRYIGRTDEPLSPVGIEQAHCLQKEKLKADFLFVSPMLRTRQTAAIAFPSMEMHLIRDFRETDFGTFEGKTAAELSNDKSYQEWLSTFCQGPIPNGENVSDFKCRCCKAFSLCVEEIPDTCCGAFVVHGGVIMSILERYVLPHQDFYDFHIPNGGWIASLWEKDSIKIEL